MTATMSPLKDINQVVPRSKEDDILFHELAAVLKKHNALDRFGITLLHKHFDFDEEQEVMIEHTDVPSRTHIIEPIAKAALSDIKYTETAWRLGDGVIAMGCVCKKYGDEHSHQHKR
jgi:hypothetical protein